MQKESRHVRVGEVRVIRRCVQKTFVLEERAAPVYRSFPSFKKKKTLVFPKEISLFACAVQKKNLERKSFFSRFPRGLAVLTQQSFFFAGN